MLLAVTTDRFNWKNYCSELEGYSSNHAERYADVTCSKDFEVSIAAAQTEANQFAVADGSTMFQLSALVVAGYFVKWLAFDSFDAR